MTIMDMQNELYNPNTMKVVVNQYVIFYEAKFQKWSNDSVKQYISVVLDCTNDEKNIKAYGGCTITSR